MFGPRTTPESEGSILDERKRLEHSAAEISRLRRELELVKKENEGLQEMNQVLSVAFRTSGHSALNKELEHLRSALNEERLRSVEARAEVIRYDEEEQTRRQQEENRAMQRQQEYASETALQELDVSRKTISGLRARIDDLEENLLKERQSVTRASAIVQNRHESKMIEMQRNRIQELENAVGEKDEKLRDLVRLVQTLQTALKGSEKSNSTLNFLRSV